MTEPYKIPLKLCPFCGGKAKVFFKNTKLSFKNPKVSFKNHAFKGQNDFGDKKLKYRVQVICNRCKSRGKPVFTDWLINPNPWMSAWGNQGEATTPRMIAQTEAFKPYVEEATKAWNKRWST